MPKMTTGDATYLQVVKWLETAEARAQTLLKKALLDGVKQGPVWLEQTAPALNDLLSRLRADLQGGPVPLSALEAALQEAWDTGTVLADRSIDAARLRAAAPTVAAAGGVIAYPQAPRALVSLAAELHGQIGALPTQILRATADAYRDVVVAVTADVASGVDTVEGAARRAVRDLEARGLRGFTDRRGRKWKASTYARMAVRTAYARAANEGRAHRYLERGVLAVIVSDATNECRLCRPWENRVLAIDEGRLPAFPVDGTVSEAVAAGLQHPNCRHSLHAFNPDYTPRRAGTPGETPAGLWPAP